MLVNITINYAFIYLFTFYYSYYNISSIKKFLQNKLKILKNLLKKNNSLTHVILNYINNLFILNLFIYLFILRFKSHFSKINL